MREATQCVRDFIIAAYVRGGARLFPSNDETRQREPLHEAAVRDITQTRSVAVCGFLLRLCHVRCDFAEKRIRTHILPKSES